MRGVTVPCLPCVSLDDSLAFYGLLGFETTYRQKAPSPYGVVKFGTVELHLFGLPKLAPEDNFSTCLILVDEVELLHGELAGAVKASTTRAARFPRISRMRPGQTRFTLTDPAGNSVIFIRTGEADREAEEEYTRPGLTSLQRAVAMAARLRDFKNDDRAAAHVLDVALAKADGEDATVVREALLARLELAEALGDEMRRSELQVELSAPLK